MRLRSSVLLLIALTSSVPAAQGGLRLTGRALIAVPQKGYEVFVTWRRLVQDGSSPEYTVFRSTGMTGEYSRIGTATATSTYRDMPGQGSFRYRVSAVTGSLKGATSNEFAVTTSPAGRDWVTIFPGTKGKRLQLGNAQFADTDGDGELEFVTHNPSMSGFWPNDKGYRYNVEVYEMFSGNGPKWSYVSGVGGGIDHHAGFHVTAFDLNGDYKADILYEGVSQVSKRNGIVVLSDNGGAAGELGLIEGGETYSMFADLGGKYYAYIQAGIGWGATAWEWNGTAFAKKWSVGGSAAGACSGNMRTWTVWDVDGDGKDEIVAGTTVVDNDGSVLYSARSAFGTKNEIGTLAIGDVDPGNAGYELFMGAEETETGSSHCLLDAKSGRVLWTSGKVMHLHNGIIAEVVAGGPLELLGSCCGHAPKSWWSFSSDGKAVPANYGLYVPMISFDISAMDWLGERGYEVRIASKAIYGAGGKLLYEPDFSDVPGAKVFPAPPKVASSYYNEWSDSAGCVRYHWLNVDLVGDYREDLPFAMPDGSIRVYVNTATPPRMGVTKQQYHSYQMTRAVSCRHGFAAALGTPTSNDSGPATANRHDRLRGSSLTGVTDRDCKVFDLRGRPCSLPGGRNQNLLQSPQVNLVRYPHGGLRLRLAGISGQAAHR